MSATSIPNDSQVAAAFADPRAVGPWFAASPNTSTDGPDGRWQDAQVLYQDEHAVQALRDRLARRLGTDQARVGASILQQGWAARLFSLGLGMLTRRALVADMSALQWRDDAGSVLMRLPTPAARPGGPAQVLDQILDEHLAPLAAGLRRAGSVPELVLRGNAASALLYAALLIDGPAGPPDGPAGLGQGTAGGPATVLARQLAQDPRLAGGLRLTSDGWRRRSCCLIYRVRGHGLCGDCVLDRPPEVRASPPGKSGD